LSLALPHPPSLPSHLTPLRGSRAGVIDQETGSPRRSRHTSAAWTSSTTRLRRSLACLGLASRGLRTQDFGRTAGVSLTITYTRAFSGGATSPCKPMLPFSLTPSIALMGTGHLVERANGRIPAS